MILRLLLINLLNLFSYNVTPTPVRLEKKLTTREKINRWINIHQFELLLITITAMIVILVLATILFFPAMDTWNNRLEDVI